MGPLSQATRLFNWLEDQTPAGIFELYVLLESVRTVEVRVSLTVSSPSLSFSRAKTNIKLLKPTGESVNRLCCAGSATGGAMGMGWELKAWG